MKINRVNGRLGSPVCEANATEDGGIVVRIDDERNLSFWAEVTLTSEDLSELLPGSSLSDSRKYLFCAKTEFGTLFGSVDLRDTNLEETEETISFLLREAGHKQIKKLSVLESGKSFVACGF